MAPTKSARARSVGAKLTEDEYARLEVAVAKSGLTAGEWCSIDLATTIIFVDDPIIAGVTIIKAHHIYNLRQAVNAVRACDGLSAATWTDTSFPGVAVKAVHIQGLRTNLNAVTTALGFAPPSYTDSTLTVGVTPIKKVRIDELRQSVK